MLVIKTQVNRNAKNINIYERASVSLNQCQNINHFSCSDQTFIYTYTYCINILL